MPINNIIQTISPADKGFNYSGSFARNGMRLGAYTNWHWCGVCIVPAAAVVAELDVISASQSRSQADRVGLVIPPASVVQYLSIQTMGAITLGVAAGKLKFAPALASADATQFVESLAATGTNLPADTVAQEKLNLLGTGTLINANTTWKLFATNGGAGAAATASTMRAAGNRDVRVIVSIGGYTFPSPPTSGDVGLTAGELQR